MSMTDEDYALALQLQSHLFEDEEIITPNGAGSAKDVVKPMSLVDPYWELTDPTPDMRALFLEFNEKYFWGRLAGVEVKWSSRMTLCAGICRYEGRGGLCSIGLSVPLLKLRPRKDLIETLLHEMIHAYLFVTDNNKDHDGHGPEFHKHMYRLNKETGTNISVYHNFHDEVEVYKQHWWRCDGPCQNRKPYFGYVKRSMNRAPSKNDLWWAEHQRTCGGSYTKIKEPEGFGKKKTKSEKGETTADKAPVKTGVKSMDIRIFGGEGKTLGKPKPSSISNDKPVKSTPTATITSGVLSRHITNSSNKTPDVENPQINKDKTQGSGRDRKITSFLPTPTKPLINRPVSQGGNVPFSKVKKKVKLPVVDFSDSDDDELLATATPPTAPSKDISGNHNCVPDDDVAGHNVIDSEKDVDVNQEEDIDTNNVRAMLRKVWGQKQILPKKILTIQDSKSDTAKDISSGQKREPVDFNLDINQACKRIKLNTECDSASVGGSLISKDNCCVSGAGSSNKVLRIPEDKSKHKPQSRTDKITSPIEKMFNRIKDSQKQDGYMGSASSRSSSDASADCENSATVVHSHATNMANSSGETNLISDTNPSEMNSIATSVCPVCNKSVPIASINDHLDLCLTLKAIS